jgi:hypothetical protein
MGATISACVRPSVSDDKHDDKCDANPILVIWDIENVRLPLPPISPSSVIEAVRKAAVAPFTRGNVKITCCVSPMSLRAMEKRCPTFVRDAVPMMDLRIACDARAPKLGADYVLQREMTAFMQTAPRGARIVLITGDADFLGPVPVEK